ncbi:unnamed protein product [Euphydryas editha]|uniref:Uncharacterized protein n=1 Tax=Euphydryas editha TaxID=104508 RepID=A0AAU9TLT8_EUPED|nr:unnamed protein product [Euphydryas editha]
MEMLGNNAPNRSLARDESCLPIKEALGVQFIPERAKVAFLNEKYFYNYTFNIRRYSRQGGYKINLESTTKQPWENNVTVHFVLFEYLHNEYRRSFVELHYKFCDFLKHEKFIAPVTISHGTKCPYPAGTHRLMNMTVPLDAFPNVFPFEKSRTDIKLTTANETMLELQLYGSFKNKLPKK